MPETKKTPRINLKRIEKTIADYRGQKWALIPLVQEIQQQFGYIPPEVIPRIASALGLFPSQVQGVITFYTQLYTEPRGKNIVRVCRGTACHVRGGKSILKLVKQYLNLDEEETTPDMEYTLETVACIGICALAPNLMINKETHGSMNPKKVARLFGKKEKE
ncbi:MAG: NADH dehydrogenase [Chloroflexi bacterium RBG_16_50_9]|nr:MAG: NADH dehydrogenase [Chloroflexi bacterium RBG_16_50_9]